MDEIISFGDWLRRRRGALGLTRDGLGRRVGLSVSAIRKLESDERRPSRETAERLAEELGISSGDRGTFVSVARSELRVDALPSPLLLGGPAAEAKDDLSFQPRETLPTPLTSFVGREELLEQLKDKLLRADVRLITLTGPGGVGKTRLALEVARRAAVPFLDGLWFVDLSSVAEPRLVLPAVARVLGLVEVPSRPTLEAMSTHIGTKHALLVLDNFEQVVKAAPQVAELLAACPRLMVLVTSRVLLRLSGEHHVPVPPLHFPEPGGSLDAASLQCYDAARLFAERVGALDTQFALTGENAHIVAEICRRLDGLPLALELAAARSNLLSLVEIGSRLQHSLGLLTSGARDLPERQRTIRATIEWSHELLGQDECLLFRRLGVFSSGWTLDSAESVCGEGEQGLGVLEALGTLVDSSLVRRDAAVRSETRYLMIETVREYAVERLGGSGEAEELGRRHADYCLALAERASEPLPGQRHGDSLDRLRREYPNLRAALGWYTSRGAAELGLRLAVAVRPLWRADGQIAEGRQWLERALNTPGAAAAPSRGRAVRSLTWMLLEMGDEAIAVDLLEEALARDSEQGDTVGMAEDLHHLAQLALARREYEQAASLVEQSIALHRESGNTSGLAWGTLFAGRVADELEEYERARSKYEETLRLARESGEEDLLPVAIWHLGWSALYNEDFGRARERFEESLAVLLRMGRRRDTSSVLQGLGLTALAQGDNPVAIARFEESLAVTRGAAFKGASMDLASDLRLLAWAACYADDTGRARDLLVTVMAMEHELGDQRGVAAVLEGFAGLAATQGKHRDSARILGAAQSLRSSIGAPANRGEQLQSGRCVRSTFEALGLEAFEEAHAEGRAMSQDDAVTYVLSVS